MDVPKLQCRTCGGTDIADSDCEAAIQRAKWQRNAARWEALVEMADALPEPTQKTIVQRSLQIAHEFMKLRIAEMHDGS